MFHTFILYFARMLKPGTNCLKVICISFLIGLCSFFITNIPDYSQHTSSCGETVDSKIALQENRLLCWLIISPETDIADFNAPWIVECDDSVFLLNKKTNKTFFHSKTHFIDIPKGKENDSLWLQTRTSIKQVYEHYLNDSDWFLIVNDDTDVDIAKLRRFLLEFDPQVPQYFSYTWPGLMKTDHRGGFVLSGEAIKWLEEVGLQNDSLCSDKHLGSERIRSCMQKLGVFSGIDVRLHQSFIPRSVREQHSSSTKMMLAWTTLVDQDIAVLAAGQSAFCPVQCELSSNKSLYTEADAIIFYAHVEDLPSLSMPPVRRFSWQRYIFFSTETTVYGLDPLPLFNWSMTYHRDSDVRSDYYGQLLRYTQSKSEANFIHRTAKNKSRLVAWLVSSCNPESQRQDYVKELMNYVKVDQFGACGTTLESTNYNCSGATHFGTWCSDIPFTKEYRFYLSLENAVCRDYVTEKFYQALDHYMVPIVLRKADYIDIAPEGSYIAADQFRSPKQLAEYLYYLSNNFEEYLKYFEWTKKNRVVWKVKYLMEDTMCRLCRMLHENRTVNIGNDMQQNWVNERDCVAGFAAQLL